MFARIHRITLITRLGFPISFSHLIYHNLDMKYFKATPHLYHKVSFKFFFSLVILQCSQSICKGVC